MPVLERLDALRGESDDLAPPRRLHFVGAGSFTSVGEQYRQHLIGLADMQPSDRVLEAGCGVGRIAIPLTEYLREGSYHGFDIVPQGIRWCQRRITPRFPNFEFTVVDV